MNVHIALYAWKPQATAEQISEVLKKIESLADSIPDVLDIMTGENTSKYGEGYTHAILVQAKNQAAIDAYRSHPDHAKAAAIIERIENKGIGVDFAKDERVHEKESQAQLMARLTKAARQISVGARYRHYKQLDYTVLALALREEDNEPCVVYRAEYGERITFIRPVAHWIEEVEVGGQRVQRFEKIDASS